MALPSPRLHYNVLTYIPAAFLRLSHSLQYCGQVIPDGTFPAAFSAFHSAPQARSRAYSACLGSAGFFCRRLRCCCRRSSCRGAGGLCGISPAFRNVVFFGDFDRFVCAFVGSPFLLTGLHCLFLRKRRRCRKCEASKNKSKATEEY